MTDEDGDDRKLRDANASDVLERIRAERFPHIDRDLVRELLRLHAEKPASEQDLKRAIDELISARVGA
jgi:HD-GYP domain-containing protein (c-di-GMP phosphodiesterase class II)